MRRQVKSLMRLDLGGGILLPLGAAPLPDSFTEVELLIAGDATSYKPLRDLQLMGNGHVEEDTQQYTRSGLSFVSICRIISAVLSLLNG